MGWNKHSLVISYWTANLAVRMWMCFSLQGLGYKDFKLPKTYDLD